MRTSVIVLVLLVCTPGRPMSSQWFTERHRIRHYGELRSAEPQDSFAPDSGDHRSYLPETVVMADSDLEDAEEETGAKSYEEGDVYTLDIDFEENSYMHFEGEDGKLPRTDVDMRDVNGAIKTGNGALPTVVENKKNITDGLWRLGFALTFFAFCILRINIDLLIIIWYVCERRLFYYRKGTEVQNAVHEIFV